MSAIVSFQFDRPAINSDATTRARIERARSAAAAADARVVAAPPVSPARVVSPPPVGFEPAFVPLGVFGVVGVVVVVVGHSTVHDFNSPALTRRPIDYCCAAPQKTH